LTLAAALARRAAITLFCPEKIKWVAAAGPADGSDRRV